MTGRACRFAAASDGPPPETDEVRGPGPARSAGGAASSERAAPEFERWARIPAGSRPGLRYLTPTRARGALSGRVRRDAAQLPGGEASHAQAAPRRRAERQGKDRGGGGPDDHRPRGGHTIHILPELRGVSEAGGKKIKETGALTTFSFDYTFDSYQLAEDSKHVKRVSKAGGVRVSWKIRTNYGLHADPSGHSAYGRGTTVADMADESTRTLAFHESCHRADFIGYLKDHRKGFPTFGGRVGMTDDEYKAARLAYIADLKAKVSDPMWAYSIANTDCVGTLGDMCSVAPDTTTPAAPDPKK